MALNQLNIRPVSGTAEYPSLVSIWRSSVDTTHEFLENDYRDEIQAQLASDYFPNVQLFVAELDGVAKGFAGAADESLEMLFVHANYRGKGIGKALLRAVQEEISIRYVDVNEQNQQALSFYESQGFAVRSRSELDGAGKPYPILHLEKHLQK